MRQRRLFLGAAAAALGLALAGPRTAMAGPVSLDVRALAAIGKTDARYQSYQLGISDVAGGRTWKGARNGPKTPIPKIAAIPQNTSSLWEARAPFDLANRRLRMLAAGLGPAYVRYSGTSANGIYFQDNDHPKLAKAPTGFQTVMTRSEWKGAVDLAKAADARIVTSFAISPGVRDASGTWTPVQARPLLAYTRAIGGEIYAAELFNEPNVPQFGFAPKGYDAAQFARDEAAFRAFLERSAPEIKIVGPGDANVDDFKMPGLSTEALMADSPQPRFDILSYHFYYSLAPQCLPANSPVAVTAAQALSESYLDRTDKVFLEHEALRDRFAPGAPIWITETGGDGCGGSPWAMTFLDSFRFVDQEARLAKLGASVIINHDLVGGRFGMLQEKTFDPRPDYWAAFLWRRFMGPVVLDAGPIRAGLHVYAQCMYERPGGVSLLAINLRAKPQTLGISGPAGVYALTAPRLQSETVLLNGRPLVLGVGDRMPALRPRHTDAGSVSLAPTSITFITVPSADNPACLASKNNRHAM